MVFGRSAKNILDLPVAVKMSRFEGDEGGKIRKNATTLVLRAAEI